MSNPKLRFGRYDYAAFSIFVAYASCSVVIPIVLVTMARELGFPLDSGGMTAGGGLQMARSLSMTVAMVVCGFAAARWGIRRSVGGAVGMMGVGLPLCALTGSYTVLMAALLVAGVGEGFVEGLGTPFVQQLHDEQPGRYVNFAHAFWSLGVLGAVLIFGVMPVSCRSLSFSFFAGWPRRLSGPAFRAIRSNKCRISTRP